VGACLAGVLPGRTAGGRSVQPTGLNVSDMLAARLKAYVLFGPIEPQFDLGPSGAVEALKAADTVIALSPFASAREFAHVILPIATFAETSGTYVNLEGRWQSVSGAARPIGESRPGWKVLRVLGNLLDLPTFDYTSSDDVTAELRKLIDAAAPPAAKAPSRILQSKLPLSQAAAERDVGIYQIDAIVRRAQALQNTRDGREAGEGK